FTPFDANLIALQALPINPEGRTEWRPVLIARGDVRVFAVLAAERGRGHAPGVLGAEPRRNFVQGEEPGGGEREQRHLAVEHREIDVAALAVARSPGERGEDGDRHPESRRK